jgi:hypothetical protein
MYFFSGLLVNKLFKIGCMCSIFLNIHKLNDIKCSIINIIYALKKGSIFGN